MCLQRLLGWGAGWQGNGWGDYADVTDGDDHTDNSDDDDHTDNSHAGDCDVDDGDAGHKEKEWWKGLSPVLILVKDVEHLLDFVLVVGPTKHQIKQEKKMVGFVRFSVVGPTKDP